MIDGAVDIKNLNVGDRITNDEECVATIKIAVIKCKDSNELTPFPDLSCSKDFEFRDIIRMIDAVREKLARMEPGVTEGEKAQEYLEKTGFKQDEDATKNSKYVKALKEKSESEGKI